MKFTGFLSEMVMPECSKIFVLTDDFYFKRIRIISAINFKASIELVSVANIFLQVSIVA